MSHKISIFIVGGASPRPRLCQMHRLHLLERLRLDRGFLLLYDGG